jgi:competence ComEA-like helix-hairpin-helix protein
MNPHREIRLRALDLKRVLAAGMVACLGSAVPLRAQEPALPEGKGKAEFARVCTGCHGLETLNGMRMSESGWAGVVDDMVSRGAQATNSEIALVTKYLAANFGTDSGAATPKSAKVNVNTASAKELVSSLGIADSDAAAIVRYRETNGSFADLPALRKVPGLDLKKLEEYKDRIDFSAESGSSGANKGK